MAVGAKERQWRRALSSWIWSQTFLGLVLLCLSVTAACPQASELTFPRCEVFTL